MYFHCGVTSDRSGDQCGLVLFHNRFGSTAGWIRESAAFYNAHFLDHDEGDGGQVGGGQHALDVELHGFHSTTRACGSTNGPGRFPAPARAPWSGSLRAYTVGGMDDLDPELLLPYLLVRRGRNQDHLLDLLADADPRLLKQALLNAAADHGLDDSVPVSREGWAGLARRLGILPEAGYVDFQSFDSDYHESWDLESAMHPQSIVAYDSVHPLDLHHVDVVDLTARDCHDTRAQFDFFIASGRGTDNGCRSTAPA